MAAGHMHDIADDRWYGQPQPGTTQCDGYASMTQTSDDNTTLNSSCRSEGAILATVTSTLTMTNPNATANSTNAVDAEFVRVMALSYEALT